ncbi:MAG: hypothetical protein KJP00_13700, partial [Bacteroidia bacterium]|nr:hypothetical protein [Bacteroidia bacterium]
LYLLHEVPLWVKTGNLKKAEFYYFEAIMALDRIQSVSGGLSSQSLPSEDGCFVTNDLISYYPNPDVRSNKKALHLTLFRDKLNEFLLGLDSDNIAIEKMYEIYGKVERFDSPYAQVSHYLGHFAPWGMDIMIALANKSLPIAKGQIFDVRVIPFYQQFTKKASPPYTRLQLEKGLPGKYDKVPEVYSKDLQIVQRLRSDLTFYSPSVNDWGWTFQAWMKYFNTELILAETIWASYKTGMPIALIIGEAIGWCSGPTGWVIGSGAIAAWTLYNNLYGGSGSEGISVSRDFKTGKERIIQTDDFPAYTYATLDESVKFVGSVSMLGAYQQKMLTPTNAAETALTLAILYSKYVDETDDASEGQVLNAKGYESDLGYWKADRGVVGIMAEDYTEYFYVPPVILSIQLDGRFKYDKIANSYDGYVYPNGFIDRKYYALDNSNKRNEFGGSVSNNSWRHRPKYPKNGPQKEKLKALFSKAEEMNWKLMTIENAPAEQQVRITIPKVQIAEWARYNEYFENDFMNKLDLKFFHGKRSDFSDNLQDKTTFEGFKKFKSYLVDETDEELVFGMRILSQSEVYNRVSSSDWDVDIDEELIDPDFARMTVKNYRRAMNHYTMTLSVPDPKDSKKRKLVTSIPLSFDRVGNSRRTDLEMNCTEEEGTIQYCCDRLEVQLDYEKNDIAAIISGYTLKKPKGPFDPPGANPGVTVTCTYTIQGASKKTDTSTSGADGLYSFSIPCKAKTATVIGLGDTINVDLGNCRQGIRVDLGGLKITQVSTIDPDLPPPPDINQD